MKVSVVVFPGSNCDHDAVHVFSDVLGKQVKEVWHKQEDLHNPDVVVIPGGFSYGDYLRGGALAKISPVMQSVKTFAQQGGPVIGICNGFQILCEAGLLPGALLQNTGMKFLSRFVHLRVENTQTPFSSAFSENETFCCPIAHNEGNYVVGENELRDLEDSGQVVFRYCSPSGEISHEDRDVNPNGSTNSIAGVCNKKGNVVGLMPHPERSSEVEIGYIGADSGRKVFESLLS